MTPADKARDNAIHCEMVKYAYRQTKDGVVVSFVVHPNDVPPALSISHIGARYMVALVELNDDETPKEVMTNQRPKSIQERRSQHNAQPQPDTARSVGAKHWNELKPQNQAGIRCGDPIFHAFLAEECGYHVETVEHAEATVRNICKVTSRKEFDGNPDAVSRWRSLDDQFSAWKLVEQS